MDAPRVKPPLGRWPVLDQIESLLRRLGFNDYTLLLVIAGLVGATTGGGVVAFRWCFENLTSLFLAGAHGHDVVEAVRNSPWWLVIALPALGGLLVGMIHRYGLRGHEFHGVAQVINAVAFLEGRIPALTTFVRFVTNALSIAVGGSVGPEGPVIELGSGLGSAFGQGLRVSPERIRTLVGCGAAAGLSAAFNAPIAGAIFALEIVLKDFAVVTFSPIIVSAVLATAVSRSVLGDAPAFPVPGYDLGSPRELVLYLGLGVLAGLLGWVFIRSMRAGERWALRLPLPRPVVTMLGGLVLGVLLLRWPELYGVGYEPAVDLLRGDMLWHAMLVLLAVKLVATNLTLSSGFAGGIFAPMLLMGGALGGAFGHFAGLFFPQHTSAVGAYALVGMAALMAAVTHAPITSILILFEMTGGYEVILPLMVSCIAAVVVSQALSTDSTFTLGFSEKGLEVNYGRESAILRSYYVEDLMHPDVAVVRVDTSFGEILDRFLENQDNHYFVVDEDDRLRGVIDIHALKGVLHEKGLRWVVIAADLMQPLEYVLARRENLEDAITLLSSADEEMLPVVDNLEDRRLVGTVSRGDILELYNREILHKDILGIKLVHRDTQSTDFVDLPAEYAVEAVPVGKALAGRTLADLDLRGRFGVNVLAVKRPGRRVTGRNELPDPQEPLQRRDRLIVVGRTDEVARLKEGADSSP